MEHQLSIHLKQKSAFSPELIGIGKPYVESLTSYLIRLAQSHTELPGDLVAREIKTIVFETYKSKDLYGTIMGKVTNNI